MFESAKVLMSQVKKQVTLCICTVTKETMRQWCLRISAVFCLISPWRNHYSRPNSVSLCSCGCAFKFAMLQGTNIFTCADMTTATTKNLAQYEQNCVE